MSGLRYTEQEFAALQRRRQSVGTDWASGQERVSYIRLVLPMPPTVNQALKIDRRKSKHRKAFEARVLEVVAANGNPHIDGRLSVQVEFTPPDNRRRDLDNLLGELLDGLTKAGVWSDDSTIDELRIIRMPVILPGESSVVVTVRRLAP